MGKTVTIPSIIIQPLLQVPINVTFRYKGYLQPDSAYITIATNATVNPPIVPGSFECAVVASPSISFNISYNTRYTLQAINEQCGTVYDEDIYVPCQQGCPNGFTLSPDGTYCYKIDTKPAAQTGGGTLAAQHYQQPAYETYGVVFYKNNGYNLDGTWDISNPALWPDIYTSNSAGTYPNGNVTSYTTGIWINKTSCTNADGTCGRINQAGIWLQGNVNYQGTLGFARQINAPVAGLYYIAVGADNYGTIILNGTVILQQNVNTVSGSQYLNSGSLDILFKFLNVYPVMLQAGPNIIEVDNNNTGGVGILALEIYYVGAANQAADEAVLIGMGSVAALRNYIVFSTSDITNGSLFDTGNYNCNSYPGYSLVYEGSPSGYACQLITKTSVNCP